MSVLTTYPSCWIINKHTLQQIDSTFVQCGHSFVERRSVPLWERRFVVWQRFDSRPILIRWRSENAAMWINEGKQDFSCISFPNPILTGRCGRFRQFLNHLEIEDYALPSLQRCIQRSTYRSLCCNDEILIRLQVHDTTV